MKTSSEYSTIAASRERSFSAAFCSVMSSSMPAWRWISPC